MTSAATENIPQQLAMATLAWTKLRRMAAYAAFDGWSLLILGVLTLAFGGYDSASGLLISCVLIATGAFEIRAVRQLRRLQAAAVKQMAYNQLVLAAALIFYAIVSLIQSRNGGGLPSSIEQAMSQTGASADDIKSQLATAMQILYLGMIAFAVVVQGSTALYYLSRRKYLQQYLKQTPDWIQQMQRDRGELSL